MAVIKPGRKRISPPLSEYEKSLDKETRKAGGVYYTPSHIIDYILKHTVEKADVVNNPFVRVLDPACGCGLFLLAAYDVLMKKFKENLALLRQQRSAEDYVRTIDGQATAVCGEDYWCEENLHRHLLHFCLFGADSDAAALTIATDSLAAKSPGQVLTANLLHCDSLIKYEQQDGQFAACDARADFWGTQFDYVIGNPPYIPVTRMSKEQKRYYQTYYECAEGRLNTFVLFVERAIEKASGKVGMIVPSRLLLNTQYGAIRRYILRKTKLEIVYETQERVFEGATVDTIVLILQTGRQTDQYEPITIERQSQGKTRVETVECHSFCSSPNVFMSFAAGCEEVVAINDIEKLSIALGDIADIRDGIIQGAVGPELFMGKEERQDGRCKPVLFGHTIDSYSCQWQGDYIWYDPVALTQLENSRTVGRGRGLRLRTPAIFAPQKILSRQTSDHIIAAMDVHGYYYMNTLHGTTVTDLAFDPWYVLAVMNSMLIRCWYAWRFAETGRSFAQVKIANLKTLPILRLETDVRVQIAELARGASAIRGLGQDDIDWRQRIDETIFQHSQLNPVVSKMMQEFAEKTGKQQVRRQIRREYNATHIN